METDLTQTQSKNSSNSVTQNFQKYLFDKNLLTENHPHAKEGFAGKQFSKCPLAFVLKHYYSSSDSEGESSSVDKKG